MLMFDLITYLVWVQGQYKKKLRKQMSLTSPSFLPAPSQECCTIHRRYLEILLSMEPCAAAKKALS